MNQTTLLTRDAPDAQPEAEVEPEAMLTQASLDGDTSTYVVSLRLP